MNKENRHLRNESIINAYISGQKMNDIKAEYGISDTCVYTVCKKASIGKRLSFRQRQVKELREQGLCCSEIADALNMATRNVRNVANKIGMPFTEEEKQRSQQIGHAKKNGSLKDRQLKESQFINLHYPEWEYIDGFKASDGFMKLRCKKCCSEIEKSAVSVRHIHKLVCPVCVKQQRIEQIKSRETEKERTKREKLLAFGNHVFYQQSFTFKECVECGNPFFVEGANQICCSEKCSKKRQNRKHDKRLKRAKIIEQNITLEKLFKRDKGICCICGTECDWNDCYRSDDMFIAYGLYPSIDHIVPLAKGGNHTWNNVQLAHHYCNTLKRDKVVNV